MLERRITALRARIDNAVLIDEGQAGADEVTIASKVELEDEHGERMQVEISSVGGVSRDSPLGAALLGVRMGDEVDIEAPGGSWRARIVAIAR